MAQPMRAESGQARTLLRSTCRGEMGDGATADLRDSLDDAFTDPPSGVRGDDTGTPPVGLLPCERSTHQTIINVVHRNSHSFTTAYGWRGGQWNRGWHEVNGSCACSPSFVPDLQPQHHGNSKWVATASAQQITTATSPCNNTARSSRLPRG